MRYRVVCCVCIRSIQVPDLDWDKKFHKMAKETEGFSGREIAKLAISWQVCTITELKPRSTRLHFVWV